MKGQDQIDEFRKYKAKQLRELGDEPDAFYHVTSKKNIPSILKKGFVKIKGNIKIEDENISEFEKKMDGYWLLINSGTIEMSANKIIVLAD